METDTGAEIFMLILSRKTLKILISKGMQNLMGDCEAARDTGDRLLREIESNKLSPGFITELIQYMIACDRRGVAEALAEAFRPDGRLTSDERLAFDCREINRRHDESSEAFRRKIRRIKNGTR
jgi:hypothetical protein